MKKFIEKNVALILVANLLTILVSLVSGEVRTVPGQYPTIQSAIDASSDGDEIIVSPGTYVENINFGGKNIILRSTDPSNNTVVANTIIDGNKSGSVVIFAGNELSTCTLSGFSITNGNASFGGGIRGNGTKATIQNNIISGNTANRGGGLYECNGTIQNNRINSNTATDFGGGLNKCNGVIKNNIISNNSVLSSGASDCGGGGICDCDGIIEYNIISGNSVSGATVNLGGGLQLCDGIIQNNKIHNNSVSGTAALGGGFSHCHGIIQNNIIYENSATSGGGLNVCNGTIQNNTIYGNVATVRGGGLYNCNNVIRNCIIWNNSASIGAEVDNSSIPSYSCIKNWTGGGEGNITSDPLLANPAGGDFHLTGNSPCIDAGCLISDLLKDFEDDPRGYDGTSEPRGDGSDYDIGADEYYVSPPPTPTPTPIPPASVRGWHIYE